MHEKEIAEALRFLGLTGSEIATPELKELVRRYGLLHLRKLQQKQEEERYFARVSSFSGHLVSIFEQAVPPLRPVEDIMEQALVEAHIPGRAIRRLYLKDWDITLDFAYPATRLCVIIGELSEVDAGSVLCDGWTWVSFSADQIRRDAAACARRVKAEYFARK
jgi:hypothetical protein